MKFKPWTDEELEILRANYGSVGRKRTAELLGVTETRVRHKASALGLRQDRESEFHAEWQSRAAKSKVGKKRPEQAAVMQKHVIDKGLHLHDENRRMEIGAQVRARIQREGHPKGMLGKKHGEAARQRMSEAGLKKVIPPEKKAEAVMKMMRTKEARGNLIPERPGASWKAGWREIGGVRKYYRSKWEANYAHYLQWLKERGQIADWKHEPKTFWFDGVKRGCVSYLPDFWVLELTGAEAYHEVKGWMDARSKTKIRRMAKYHPTVKLVVIDAKGYRALLKSVQGLVPGWEAA